MSRLLYKTGLPLAFCAALILTLPACSGGPEEIWQPEALVEESPVEAMHFNESVSSGKLTLTASQKVVARETPIERLTLLYTDSHIEFDWESFGFTFFAILGGIVSIGLYFVVAYVLYDPNKDDKNK